LAKRYNVCSDSLSRRFALIQKDGKTANQHQIAFKQDYKCQLNAKIAAELADRELAFRTGSMAVAELGLRHVAGKLTRVNSHREILSVPAADLASLMNAAKKAVEVGMVALDRPIDGTTTRLGVVPGLPEGIIWVLGWWRD
jgi:hypothetical protein